MNSKSLLPSIILLFFRFTFIGSCLSKYVNDLAVAQYIYTDSALFTGIDLRLNVQSSTEGYCNVPSNAYNTYLKLSDVSIVSNPSFSIQMRFADYGIPSSNVSHTLFFYGNSSRFIWVGVIVQNTDTFDGHIIFKSPTTFAFGPSFTVTRDWNFFSFGSSPSGSYVHNYQFTSRNTNLEYVTDVQNNGLPFDFSQITNATFTIGWVPDTISRSIIEGLTNTMDYLPARIDEIRIYQTMITSLSIEHTTTWAGEPDPGMVALWPIDPVLDGGNPQAITDSIGKRTFQIINHPMLSEVYTTQSGDSTQCPVPAITTNRPVPAGDFVDLFISPYDIAVGSFVTTYMGPPTITACIVTSSSTCVTDLSQVQSNGTVQLRLEPQRPACGLTSNVRVTAPFPTNFTIYSVPFQCKFQIAKINVQVTVNQTLITLPTTNGTEIVLTGNFGLDVFPATGPLNGNSDSVYIYYNYNQAPSILDSSFQQDGLHVRLPTSYGTGYLKISMCNQVVNVSVKYPAPELLDVSYIEDVDLWSIYGSGFSVNKTWNENDVTFDWGNGPHNCNVTDFGTSFDDIIGCTLAKDIPPGKQVTVLMKVGDQTGSFEFTSPQNEKKPNKKDATPFVAGIVVGVLILACAIAAAIFIVRRQRKKNKSAQEEGSNAVELAVESTSQASIGERKSRKDYWEIPYSELSLDKEIGKGSFGVIYLAKWRNTSCVVKQMQNVTQKALQEFQKETDNVKPHPNICMVLGVCSQPETPLCIVMEYVPDGSLWGMLTKGLKLNPDLVMDFALDVARGMSHLHHENIIHCDLACRNLLVAAKGQSYTIKITDFGLSKITENDHYEAKASTVIAVRWASPEALTQRIISPALDVWAYGITLWEMSEVKQPYYDMPSNSEVIVAVTEGRRLPRPKKVAIPDKLWEIMQSCWHEELKDRPSFDQICQELDQFRGPTPEPTPANNTNETPMKEAAERSTYLSDTTTNNSSNIYVNRTSMAQIYVSNQSFYDPTASSTTSEVYTTPNDQK